MLYNNTIYNQSSHQQEQLLLLFVLFIYFFSFFHNVCVLLPHPKCSTN